MAAFHAEERGEAAAEFGKEDADAAVAKMRKRLEKLKALQVIITVVRYWSTKNRELLPVGTLYISVIQFYTIKV